MQIKILMFYISILHYISTTTFTLTCIYNFLI